MYQGKRWLTMVVCFTLLVSGVMIPGMPTFAQAKNLAPLSSVPVPLPPNLGDFVLDQQAAIQLGKALFWDQQLGGDGKQACATCHFQAGADIRSTNCVNPGKDGVFQTLPPGSAITADKFPIRTCDDIVGSNGVTDGNFLSLNLGSPFDFFKSLINALFGTNRLVTGRNAPSAVNAIYYYRNFWDGRANNTFNGVDPSGPVLDQSHFVYKVVNGEAIWVSVQIPDASLASQACGPPNSPVEMAYAGRSFQLLGRKMLALTPLAEQVVDPTDSVLGGLAATGLNTTYAAMIQAAFRPEWWDYNGVVANGFNMMEANFSLYFGLAVMMYESTLVSDQSPLDKFLEGDAAALTKSQKLGMSVYTGKGKCAQCHGGAELSEATVSQTGGNPKKGFTNTGVRPVAEDGGDILQPGQAKFKAPTLRNIELTGPYFHNGGYATLRQVVEFYNRGGDFPNKFTDSDVRVLGLTAAEKRALVNFMVAMTDERVRYEKAPFDHPSMTLANGTDLPAVGAAGGAAPLSTFLNLDPHQH
jgi:cytochrome c peroxidase